MAESLVVTRSAKLPDSSRVALCRRAPEHGPRILFFSGGTALRATSRALKHLTHNSVHLITPFDSGGSSARLREAFSMCAVGDLRNRVLALADEGARGSPEIYRLFSHRLDETLDADTLRKTVDAMARGAHPLVEAVPEPMRQLVVTQLQHLWTRVPETFDFKGASIGNLVLAGGYLENARDIDAVVYLFSQLVDARGHVRPVVDADLHLAAALDDGSTVVGQHLITSAESSSRAKIERLSLVDSLDTPTPTTIAARNYTLKIIRNAAVICFPMGSFYSSVIANLLPEGIGAAIASARCPKIFVPNMVDDVEQRDMSVADATDVIVDCIRNDVERALPGAVFSPTDALSAVLLDRDDSPYENLGDLDSVSANGIQVVRTQLATKAVPTRVDATRLSEILVSLA